MGVIDNYVKMLRALFPRGRAFPTSPGSVTANLVEGFAAELERVHNRALNVIDEMDPRTTSELLSDWERLLKLPDDCSPTDLTTEQRRTQIKAKYGTKGGQSRQYFIDLAASLGFEITITEFRPFLVGRSCVGQPLYNNNWRFVWRVNGPDSTTSYFETGVSSCGDPLATWGNELLECTIAGKKPSHTHVIFAYEDE